MLLIIEKVASKIDTNDLDLACINEHKSFHHIKYYRLHALNAQSRHMSIRPLMK